MHSLEVLDTMLKDNILGFPRESLIIVALFHDLGKAVLNGQKIGRGKHPARFSSSTIAITFFIFITKSILS